MRLDFAADATVESTIVLRAVCKTLLENAVPDESSQNIILALSEASTNCVIHAKSDFAVFIDIHLDSVIIEVSDSSGSYFDGNSFQPPQPGTVDGKMGILTIKSLMDETTWYDNGKGTSVRMVKRTKSVSDQEVRDISPAYNPTYA